MAHPVSGKPLQNSPAPTTLQSSIRTLISSGNNLQALSLLVSDRARKTLPTHERLYLSGRANQELKRNVQALIDYTAALTLKPSLFKAYINRALVRGALQDFPGAQADLNLALRLQPNNPEAFLNRGVILASLNRPQDAISDFNRAIRLKPDYADAYRNRGIANGLLRNYLAACQDWQSGARFGAADSTTEINNFCAAIPGAPTP
jgi:tetratricopeptide (TPR) repeat protein